MAESAELKVDIEQIRKTIQFGLPYTITTYALPHEVEAHIEQVLAAFLKLVGKDSFKDYLIYVVQELTVNAKKANTKRVYFAERKLDIANPEDYKSGMTSFKSDTMSNIAHYLQLQKDHKLYIKLSLISKKDQIIIEVRNNSVISRAELIRIHDRLMRAQQYNSMEDAFNQVLDDSEGAGLGIVVMVLMLKKMGLDKSAFDITGTETETIARVIIPLDRAQVEAAAALTETIVNNVNNLPHFPENILMVQQLLDDPKSELTEIAAAISRDPAMTADLIKIVNSAAYMQVKRIDSIGEAVRIIGIRGINNLMYSYGTQKILGEDTGDKKSMWDHAYRTAFYAYNLAQNFKKNHDILDDVFVAGILHDMGKIVFSRAHPELYGKMRSFCTEKEISHVLFEDIAGGMNHAEIGALIAEKWNFPENLVTAIRYHHNPLDTDRHNDLVESVYLANNFTHIEDGSSEFEQIDATVLNNFGLMSKKEVLTLIEKFSAGLKVENHKRKAAR